MHPQALTAISCLNNMPDISHTHEKARKHVIMAQHDRRPCEESREGQVVVMRRPRARERQWLVLLCIRFKVVDFPRVGDMGASQTGGQCDWVLYSTM